MKSIAKLLIILSFIVTISACNTVNIPPKTDDFTASMTSPQIPMGEVEIQFETLIGLGKLKKQNVAVLYFPREDVVCLKYKYEFYTYNQFWSKKGRLSFINALQKYNEDYDARNLQRNKNKSQLKYGTIRGYLIWQQLSITVQARAGMNVDLGYTFKDKSPYFSVYQRDTEYIDSMGRDNDRISPNVTMYFTRAQATELAELFEQCITPSFDVPDEKKGKDGLQDIVNDTLDYFKPTKTEDAAKDEY
jgi:hypothetical protein